MFEFEVIINRIIKELDLKNKTDLSKKMNVSTQVMGNWKNRNKIPFEEIHKLCEFENLDINYIFNGKKNDKKEKKINYKEKITENLEKLNEKELKYYNSLIETRIAEKEI